MMITSSTVFTSVVLGWYLLDNLLATGLLKSSSLGIDSRGQMTRQESVKAHVELCDYEQL